MKIERKEMADESAVSPRLMLTPRIGDDDYWTHRVEVSGSQAIQAFPKFGTIGIGFEKEEDWNTNLPYTEKAKNIYAHIAHNKGDKRIKKSTCIAAIKAIKAKICEIKGATA